MHARYLVSSPKRRLLQACYRSVHNTSFLRIEGCSSPFLCACGVKRSGLEELPSGQLGGQVAAEVMGPVRRELLPSSQCISPSTLSALFSFVAMNLWYKQH